MIHFGLCNVPATYQGLMQKVVVLFYYLDNIFESVFHLLQTCTAVLEMRSAERPSAILGLYKKRTYPLQLMQ